MYRQEFLDSLNSILCNYPRNEVDKCLEYYNEGISDRMECGMSEEEAVADLGDIYAIADNFKMEMPITTLVRQKVMGNAGNNEEQNTGFNENPNAGQKKGRSPIGTVLMIFGLIFAIPLLIALVSVIFSIIIVLWSLVLAAYCTVLALGAASAACLIAGIVSIISADSLSFYIYFGAAFICASLTILFGIIAKSAFKGAKAATFGIIKGIKKALIKKGA